MRGRVVVTGIGIVGPLGRGASASFSHLVNGKSGVSKVALPELPFLPPMAAGIVPTLAPNGEVRRSNNNININNNNNNNNNNNFSRPFVINNIGEYEIQGSVHRSFITREECMDPDPVKISGSATRSVRLAMAATEEALEMSGLLHGSPLLNESSSDNRNNNTALTVEDGVHSRIGVSIGTGIASLADVSSSGASLRKPTKITNITTRKPSKPEDDDKTRDNNEEEEDAIIESMRLSYRRTSPYLIPRILTNTAAGDISRRFLLGGPCGSPSTACATGAHAIIDAVRAIADGSCEAFIAGAAESAIHPVAVAGFSKMRALSNVGRDEKPMSPSHSDRNNNNHSDEENNNGGNGGDDDALFDEEVCTASRPFSKGRDGFVMAEGAAVLIVESLESARARGADIIAEIIGYGSSLDAHHATAPRPDGTGAARALKSAFASAGIRTSDNDRDHNNDNNNNNNNNNNACAIRSVSDIAKGELYINAHATSTPRGDAAEVAAVKKALGEDVASGTLVSSTKGATGHLLGAAGAIEAAYTVLALSNGIVPPTLNLSEDSLDDDCRGVDHVFESQGARKAPGLALAACNSFAFGGMNATVLFSKWGKK